MINGTPLDRIMTGGNVGKDKSQTLSDSRQADVPKQTERIRKEKKMCFSFSPHLNLLFTSSHLPQMKPFLTEPFLGFHPNSESRCCLEEKPLNLYLSY